MMDRRTNDYSRIEVKIKECNDIRLSYHAQKRLKYRQFTMLQLLRVLSNPFIIRHQCCYINGMLTIKYTLQGKKLNKEFGVVIALQNNDVVVITVMDFDHNQWVKEEGVYYKVC